MKIYKYQPREKSTNFKWWARTNFCDWPYFWNFSRE